MIILQRPGTIFHRQLQGADGVVMRCRVLDVADAKKVMAEYWKVTTEKQADILEKIGRVFSICFEGIDGFSDEEGNPISFDVEKGKPLDNDRLGMLIPYQLPLWNTMMRLAGALEPEERKNF